MRVSKPAVIGATVDIVPDTLNEKSKGPYVTAYIELPEGPNVATIDISSLFLQGSIPAEIFPTAIGDYDNDGITDLMVRFDRASLQALVSPGDAVEITLTGSFFDETNFEGSDDIRVIDKGKAHIDHGNPASVEY